MAPAFPDDSLHIVVGVAWAVIVGGIVVGHVTNATRRKRDHGARFRTAEMGLVERAIFFGATVAGAPEIIAGWLVLKVGTAWTTWRNEPGVFNGFATGTGLSLAFGVSGGLVALALRDNAPERAVLIALAPLALAVVVWLQHRAPLQYRRLMDPEAQEDDWSGETPLPPPGSAVSRQDSPPDC